MTMKISLISSLEHACCTRIVTLLFQEVLPYVEIYFLDTSKLMKSDSTPLNCDPDVNYNIIYTKISERIKILVPQPYLLKKLQCFIGPLFYEIEDWLQFCHNSWLCYDDSLLIVLKSIPHCWSSNGSIDREKSAKILVKNRDLRLPCRFILACNFCLFDDVLDLWKRLDGYEEVYLLQYTNVVLPIWIEWLESRSEKDWRTFIQWALDTELYYRNVYILKDVFKTLNSVEKGVHLSNILTKREVNSDVMYYGLSIMTRDEQELILKKSPIEVFKCVTSWPIRSSFHDIVGILMPYITWDAFRRIVNIFLPLIKTREKDDELLVILKKFWASSPLSFRNFAKNNSCISEPLQIVLDYNFTEAFPREKFFDSFHNNAWYMK